MVKDVRPAAHVRAFYDLRAKALIKEAREERQMTYKDLARRLEAQGTVMDVQVLINRVNKGRYTFAFALQLLAAMGVDHLKIPPLETKLRKPEVKKLHG